MEVQDANAASIEINKLLKSQDYLAQQTLSLRLAADAPTLLSMELFNMDATAVSLTKMSSTP